MALNWDWNKKVGEAVFDCDGRKERVNLYEGNALLIFIWEDDESSKYQMKLFLMNKDHAKNCFGISKDYKDNILDTPNGRLTEIKFYTDKSRYYPIVIDCIAKAKWTQDVKIILSIELPY